jgi:ABC-type multidrug transport system fused ATPase/permease subunit
LNELEEIKLIKSLKNSGAATLMTSKRWTMGRFATRIVVIQNGTVVESGTHAELIARGADHSLYAARWAQMMSS